MNAIYVDMSRPSDYEPEEHPKAVHLLSSNGKSYRAIAEALGIALSTFERWLKIHPAFQVHYRLGKEEASDRVERALFERANGYSHMSEKIFVVGDGHGKGAHVVRVPTLKHYPPEVSAIKFFLTNRRPQVWCDGQQTNPRGRSRVTPEDLVAARARRDASAPE